MATLPRYCIVQQHHSTPYLQSGSPVKQSSGSCSQRLFRSRVASRSSSWSLTKTGVSSGGQTQVLRGSLRAKDGDEQSDSALERDSATSSSPGESNLGGAKGFGARPKVVLTEEKRGAKSPSASGSVRRAPPSKPVIGVQQEDQQTQQIETAVVASLGFLFVIILLEGLLLAASGFLPEEWDQFAVTSVYPAFTPSVGVFLAVAASYGLWKYLGGGTGTGRN